MTKRSKDSDEYSLLLKRLSNCKTSEEARLIHKELKKYGDGMPLWSRYPKLPDVIATIALIIAVLVFIMSIKI